ncbi:MAG: hypothetical protein LC627_00110, partial [Verrucomicrobiaceae bacterium]|nr:hypothetical protein [Verrucomicrobiaceae bacterium]
SAAWPREDFLKAASSSEIGGALFFEVGEVFGTRSVGSTLRGISGMFRSGRVGAGLGLALGVSVAAGKGGS